MTRWVLERMFGGSLRRSTSLYLRDLAREQATASRRKASALLAELRAAPGPKVMLGETEWCEPFEAPLSEFIGGHGLITGATGTGKTMISLALQEALLRVPPGKKRPGTAGIPGAKQDLYHGLLELIVRYLRTLSTRGDKAAAQERRRIRIHNFASKDPIASYNPLVRPPQADADSFAARRLDLLFDLIPEGDSLALAAPLFKSLLQLFSQPEINLSIRHLVDALDDERLLERVLLKCKDAALVAALKRQLATVARSTIAALRRRLESLVSSDSVRIRLSGPTAPDFRRLQDEAAILVFNYAGSSISERTCLFLQTLTVSDLCRTILDRQQPENPFVVVVDEAQNLLASPVMREQLTEALRLARSSGTHFWFLTQNLSAAVQDARVLKQFHTNIKWSLSFRGEPADCSFLAPFLPVTGRRPKPKLHPFEETSFYTIAEERAMEFEAIANLPDRVAWLWLRGRSTEAIKIRTRTLDIPQGRALREATLAIERDPTIGNRCTRKEYDRLLAERDRAWAAEESEAAGVDEELARAYRRRRKPASTERSAGASDA